MEDHPKIGINITKKTAKHTFISYNLDTCP